MSGLDYGYKNQLLIHSLIARTSAFEAFGQEQEPMVSLTSVVLMIAAVDSTYVDTFSSAVNAIGVDFTMQIKSQTTTGTVLDEVKKLPVYSQLDSIPRITKEQFYDLSN